jgi:GAF domain-containing protein
VTDGSTGHAALLLALARQVTARHDVTDILADIFRMLRPLVGVGVGGGSIQLLDDAGWIQMAAAEPAAPAHVLAQAIPLATSIAGRVILTERPVYLPDIAAAGLGGGRAISDVRSYLGIPLIADGAAIGVLQLDSPEPDAWSADVRELLAGAAPVVAAAIQNARAHARAKAAHAQAATATARLHEARALVEQLRVAVGRGSAGEVADVANRLALLLGEGPAADRLGAEGLGAEGLGAQGLAADRAAGERAAAGADLLAGVARPRLPVG